MTFEPNAIKGAVWQQVRSCQNALVNPIDDAEITDCLELLRSLLSGKECARIKLPFPEIDLKAARKVFAEEHYSRMCDFLIQQISVEWIKRIKNVHELFDNFFLSGVHHQAFISLCYGIECSSPGYRQQKCVSLLERFLSAHLLTDVTWDQCCHPSAYSLQDEKTAFSSMTQSLLVTTWEDMLSSIVSLPDKMANTLKQENSDLFFPRHYIPLVARDMLSCLHKVHKKIKCGSDCSVQFLSHLLGRLCINGHGEMLWDTLLPVFSQYTQSDYIWVRLCNHLITRLPERCLQSVIIPVIMKASWYGVVAKLLQDSICHNIRLQQLLTSKLLFMRHFENAVILQNIIGYITSSHSTRHLFIPLFLKLLKMWGDKTGLKQTSYEQHVYITKAVLVCVAFTTELEQKEHGDEILSCLMPGVQNHLGHGSSNVQRLGMIVAENVTKFIKNSGEKLQFQYPMDQEVEALLSLLTPPSDPGVTINEQLSSLNIREDKIQEQEHSKTQEQPDLDSDDDLEPYDMSNDTKQSTVKAPVYVRDCMEGLITSDNPDRVEVCLTAAEKLIRRKPDNLQEIAVEMTKILLHLENNFHMPSFMVTRQAALVALGVECPIKVASYLCEQFYDRNYSIRHRLDILQVLSAVAQELSQPNTQSKQGQGQPDKPVPPRDQTKHWRQIVEDRIEKNTRRFGKGPTKEAAPIVESRFANVAGHFFFPLLKSFDRCIDSVNLLGEDCLVLERLLYTLGMVLHCATNSMIIKQMGKAMLEFVWVLRYHSEVAVRRALLFCVSMTILSVPGFVLMSDLQSELMETKAWLEDTMSKDEDTECRKLASHALLLMQQIVQQEFSNT